MLCSVPITSIVTGVLCASTVSSVDEMCCKPLHCGGFALLQPAMADTSIKVSLRSLGDEDTTVITQAYGGGGHRNASSCVVLAAEFECWKV